MIKYNTSSPGILAEYSTSCSHLISLLYPNPRCRPASLPARLPACLDAWPADLACLPTCQDIINSEMGYMGWFDSESYGLTWKVG